VLTPFGANIAWRSSLQDLPTGTGQTGVSDRSDRSLENLAVDQRTPAREGPRQGKHTLGCPRLGRSVRTSSHAAEVVEEQHMGLEK
jgi:hypothetical protein